MSAERGSSRAFLWFLPLAGVIGVSALLAVSCSEPGKLSLGESFAGPSVSLPLGAGEGGVDLGAFVGHACLRVLLLSACVAALSGVMGVMIGAIAVQWRGTVEHTILRICDLVQAFPSFLLALSVLAAVRQPERWHLGVVFCLLGWAPFARLLHAMARTVIQAEFVVATRALGAGRAYIMRVHVIPHIVGPLAVQAGSSAAGVVLAEASLGFVGLGPSDGVSLGALLEQGTVAMLREPRVIAVGAIAIALTSGALQLASEGLRALGATQRRS